VRKVVVATNVAETSVTLPDVAYVVDCGFVKLRRFDARTGSDALVVAPISQASAAQRAGRAGRVRAGVCFHLYTAAAHAAMRARDEAELQRSALEQPLLTLKALGVDDLAHFDFPAPPPAAHVSAALERLHALQALDDSAALTAVGAAMAQLPVSAVEAHLLLTSGCSEEALSIVAMLQAPLHTLFTASTRTTRGRLDAARARFAVREGDHVTLLNIFAASAAHGHSAAWCAQQGLSARVLARAAEVRSQLRTVLRALRVPLASAEGDVARIVKAVARSLFAHAAQRQSDGSYRALRSEARLQLHPASVLFAAPPEWVVYQEVVHTREAYMRHCTAIDAAWLPELAPHYYTVRHRELLPNPATASASTSTAEERVLF
jgi:ATP-dependent RNA helicase DDX35